MSDILGLEPASRCPPGTVFSSTPLLSGGLGLDAASPWFLKVEHGSGMCSVGTSGGEALAHPQCRCLINPSTETVTPLGSPICSGLGQWV